jgi:uncharacterized protein
MQRGPIVFCMEQLDQAAGRDPRDFYFYTARVGALGTAKYEPDLLNGVVTLEQPGSYTAPPASQPLYEPETATGVVPVQSAGPTTLKLIPYYAWANREDSAMQVWIPDQPG